MNKRIKAIANKAGCDYLYDYSEDGHAVVCNLSDIEKFAKLIIQECLSVIEEMNPHDTERDIDDIFDEVDKHFGVE